MKKKFTIYAAIIVCAFAVTVISCSKDPVDKALDKMESLIEEINKLEKEDSPSPKEIISIQNDAKELQQLGLSLQNETIANNKITEKQQARFITLIINMQGLFRGPGYQRLEKLARQYNLDH